MRGLVGGWGGWGGWWASIPLAIRKGLAVLAKYGSEAHLFIPGIGRVSGVDAGNFVESSGITPAALLNPVGMVVDASQGGTTKLGTEKAGTESGWAPTAGCTIVDGTFVINNVPNSGGASKINLTIGNYYKVSFKIYSISGCGITVYLGNTSTGSKTVAGEYSFILPCTAGGTLRIYVSDDASAINSAVISNLSVRSVPGIHLTQITTANKPILGIDPSGVHYWQKGASAAWLSGAPLFNGTVRDYYTGVAFIPATEDITGTHYFFTPAITSDGAAYKGLVYVETGVATIRDTDGTTALTASLDAVVPGGLYTVSAIRSADTLTPKVNGVNKTQVTAAGQVAITPINSFALASISGASPAYGKLCATCAVQATITAEEQTTLDTMLDYISGRVR